MKIMTHILKMLKQFIKVNQIEPDLGIIAIVTWMQVQAQQDKIYKQEIIKIMQVKEKILK